MENAEGIDLTQSFAPFYWGFIISLLLAGITIVQAYIYFPSRDRFLVRFTAGAMLVLDLASSFMIAQSVYYYLIPHFGSLVPFSTVTPALLGDCFINATITFISQTYFVYQLYAVNRLGKYRWLVLGSIGSCAAMSFASGIACVTTMRIFDHGVFSVDRNRTFSIFFGISKGFGALTDVLATIAMCIYLTTSKTGIRETTNLLNRLMRFVIHRGALVTLIQVILLVAFFAGPHKLYWIPFHLNVTKLYTNTFFAMLNARKNLAEMPPTFHSVGFNSAQYDLRGMKMEEGGELPQAPMPTITKTVETSAI